MNCHNLQSLTLSTANYSLSTLFSSVPTSLTTLVVLGGTSIANYFLSSNHSVSSLSLPTTITSVGASAFYNYDQVSTIYLPNVTQIGNNAFYLCTATVYTFATSAYQYGEAVFQQSGITSFTMPTGITTLRKNTFSHCHNLTSITLNSDLKYIEEGAFEYCDSLVSITLPNVLTIGKYAFRGCSALTSITLPSTLTSLGENAFDSCLNLTTVNFSSASVAIDKNCFYNCPKLANLQNTGNITTLGVACFANIKNTITTANFPKAQVAAGVFNGWSNMTTLNIGSISTTTLGACFSATSFTNTYAAEQDKTNYYIPNGLTTLTINLENNIASYYAANFSSLITVNFAEGLKTIGKAAFYQCTNIDHLYLPNSITRIYTYAFSKLDNCRFVDSHFEDDTAHKIRNLTVEEYAFSFKKLQWMVPPTGDHAALVENCVLIQLGSSTTPKFYLGVQPMYGYSTNWISPNNTYSIYVGYSEGYSSLSGFWHYVDGVPTLWN